MQENEYWQAVLNRDREYDGKFVFAVRSTKVFCRPSCPSRRPKRENVQFYSLSILAERAGFRACRRCQPDRATPSEPQLELTEQICRYLAKDHELEPTLAELARQFHMSAYHLQRTFKRIVGITPKQYATALKLERFKDHLKKGAPVTEALYQAGYQSSSSLYEHATEQLGMTPTLYRRGGETVQIAFSLARCSLGWLMVAATGQGICAVRLGDTPEELEQTLRREFPAATIRRSGTDLGEWVDALLEYISGERPHLSLPLDVQATAFQRRVWEALQAIPYGNTRSYAEIAQAIGQPTAARAVARACAENPVALAIPCHRVIRGDGTLGGYRWGIERKRKLLDGEARHILQPEK